MTRALLAASAVCLVAAIGCEDWLRSDVPSDARALEQLEADVVAGVVSRWTASDALPAITDGCGKAMARERAIDADTHAMLRWCERCPPTSVDAGCTVPSYSRGAGLGRAYGCFAWRAGVPIVIVSIGLPPDEHTATVGHESTHLLAHCMRVRHLDHDVTGPVWGPGGVWPL